MYHVWDGSEWNSQKALKVWNGSAWVKTPKFKVRTGISWLPTSVSDTDISQIVKWSVGGPTPPPPPPTPTHPVPNLDLKTTTELDALLTPLLFGYTIAGYDVTSVLANDNKVVPNSQNPPAGQLMAEGLDVSVRLYNFVQPTATVPNLNGLLTSAANSAITNAGFVVGTPLTPVETYNTNLIGKIVADSQFPAAGNTEDTGTSIIYDYYVQKAFTTVPDLTGIDESDIFLALDNANLQIGTRTTTETTNTALEYTVRSQSPLPGSPAETDSPVNYNVYIPNSNTTVPNLIGLFQADADDLLKDNELYLGTVTNVETTNASLEGKVGIQQYPQGTSRPVNTTVAVTVYVPNTTVAVPNIIGMSASAAETLIEGTYELNLGLSGTSPTNDPAKHLTIKSTNPIAGTVVPIYSTVLAEIWVIATYPVPNLFGLTPQPQGTAVGPDGFTWGSGSLNATSTTNANLIGKVATQSPIFGNNTSAMPIAYGVYSDGRSTMPNVVGMTEANAKTAINAAGLNWNTPTTQALTSGQSSSLIGTVASQGTQSGQKLDPGTYVSFVVYTAYQPQPVTRTGNVSIGYSGMQAAEWIASYKNTAGSGAGTRERTSQPFYVGQFSTTNGKNMLAWTFNWNTFLTNANIVAGTTDWTVTAVQFRLWVNSGSGNDAAKSLRLGSYPADVSSSPTTMNESAINTRGQVFSISGRGTYGYVNLNSTLISDCFTAPNYPLVVYAPNTSLDNYISNDADLRFDVTISWTEFV